MVHAAPSVREQRLPPRGYFSAENGMDAHFANFLARGTDLDERTPSQLENSLWAHTFLQAVVKHDNQAKKTVGLVTDGRNPSRYFAATRLQRDDTINRTESMLSTHTSASARSVEWRLNSNVLTASHSPEFRQKCSDSLRPELAGVGPGRLGRKPASVALGIHFGNSYIGHKTLSVGRFESRVLKSLTEQYLYRRTKQHSAWYIYGLCRLISRGLRTYGAGVSYWSIN